MAPTRAPPLLLVHNGCVIIRLVSDQPLQGKAVIVEGTWEDIEGLTAISAECRDGRIEADLGPGQYHLFVSLGSFGTTISPWPLTVAPEDLQAGEVELPVPSRRHQIVLRCSEHPASLQTILVADDLFTASMKADERGVITLFQDPRLMFVETPPDLTASFREL